VIEGIEKDRLLVRFWKTDRSDGDREVSFVVDVSSEVYKGAPILSVCRRRLLRHFFSGDLFTPTSITANASRQSK